MQYLTVKDLQDLNLAAHTEQYIKQEQMNNRRGGGMRSSRNSKSYQDYQERMEDKFGGVQ